MHVSDKLVSVVIPVYNVEDYVEVCIKSVINQSYENIEIIIVDDGSTDKSAAICESFIGDDPRIRLFHKENGGLSSARNYGVARASGQYLYFLDSDDEIEPETIETLLKLLVDSGSDMAVGGYKYIDEYGNELQKVKGMVSAVMQKKQALEYFYLSDSNEVQKVTAWNKLYLIDKFKEVLYYPTGKIHEDEFLAHKIWNTANKAVLTDIPLYLYRKRQRSIMDMSTVDVKRLDTIEAFVDRFKYTALVAPQYTNVVWGNIIELFFLYYCRGKDEGGFRDVFYKKRYFRLIKEFRKVWSFVDKGMFSNKERLITTTLVFTPMFYLEYRRIKYLRYSDKTDADVKVQSKRKEQ